MHKNAVRIMALVSSVTTTLAAHAAPADEQVGGSEMDQLRAMVKDLQGQVDTLKAQNDDQWLTEQRAAQIRGVVQDVLADADTRASLLQSGAMAGYDKGFFISSADGNFLLRTYGQLQIRYVYNSRDDDPGVDTNREGFEIRRAKIGFKGHVFDPSWQYDILFAADRTTGNVQLEDNGWVQKDLGNGFKIKFGQFKSPYSREEVLSSTRLFAVERTLVNSFFTAGTTQGLLASYEADRWRVSGSYNDGNRTQNTSWAVEDTEWAFAARGEFLAIGEDFKSNDQYNGFRGTANGLVLGAGINYQQQEFGTGSGLPLPDFNNNEVTTFGLTGDVTWLSNGWSVAGAVFYRKLDPQAGDSADQVGFWVRGGYFLAEAWELYGQYEWASADIDGIDDMSVLTVGVNRYFDRHNLKWQTDIGYSFNEMASVFANEGAGYLPDANDGEIVVRSQFQLLF